MEEQVHAALCDGQIADLVHDQQGRTGIEADLVGEPAFAFGFDQGFDQLGQCGAVDLLSGRYSGDPQGCRQVRFAGAGRAKEVDDFRPADGELRARLKALSSERRRFGYRRLHILLKREGWVVNWKRLYRIYREERLTVRKRGGRKRAVGMRTPIAIPQGPNQRWSLDFVSDSLSCGRRFRILNVIDDFSRECLAAVVDT